MKTHHVQNLRGESERFLEALSQSQLLRRVIDGEAEQPEYVRFLVASYQYVRWSGFLLAKTAQGLQKSGRCPELLAAVDQKAVEEGPHDRWLLRDLHACGVNTELVKGQQVPQAVQAYVAWSLTQTEAGSPAFLGAAYTLEFISMRRASLASRNLCAKKAIPNIERAVRFLDGHGDADQGHIAELEALLDAVTDAKDQADIAFSAALMRRLYLRFFAADAHDEVTACCA